MGSMQIADTFVRSAVSGVLTDMIIAGGKLDAPLNTRIRPGFETACWTYSDSQHHIFIGDAVMPMPRQKENLSLDERQAFYKALTWHELGHARWTSKNFEAMNAMCARGGYSMQTLNLFEDCRIEEKHRQAYGENLGWKNFVSEPVTGKNPESLLYKMIEEETSDVSWPDAKMLARVQAYRDRVVNAKTTFALSPIIEEWQQEFGQSRDAPQHSPQQQQQQQGSGGQQQPPQSGPDSGKSPDAGDQGKGNGGQEQQTPDEKQNGQQPAGGKGEASGNDRGDEPEQEQGGEAGKAGKEATAGKEVEEGDKGVLADRGETTLGYQLATDKDKLAEFIELSEAAITGPGNSRGKGDDELKVQLAPDLHQQVDFRPARKVAEMLTKILKGQEGMVSTNEPSRRLNRRALVNSQAPLFRRKEEIAAKKLNISLIVDCSGSMGGKPIENAVVLAAALHVLAKRGLCEGTVFTSVTNAFDSYKIGDEDGLKKIHAYGAGEGLESTMKANLATLKKADAVFVFTDGDLVDAPLDKKGLKAQGIEPIGLYVGNLDKLASLQKYFDKSIVRDGIEEIAFALSQKLRSGPSRNRDAGMSW